MVDENTIKMPWESKTDLLAFLGILFALAASFGYAKGITIEQIGMIGTVLFTLIAIARQYGGGVIVWSQGAKDKVLAKQAAELEEKCNQ